MSKIIIKETGKLEEPFILYAIGEYEDGCEESIYWVAHGIYGMVVTDSIDKMLDIMAQSITKMSNIKEIRTNSRLLRERIEQLLSQA
ncbi:MAG: hypothetical protein QXT64_02285 [Desulfurococcaceae archaeon]